MLCIVLLAPPHPPHPPTTRAPRWVWRGECNLPEVACRSPSSCHVGRHVAGSRPTSRDHEPRTTMNNHEQASGRRIARHASLVGRVHALSPYRTTVVVFELKSKNCFQLRVTGCFACACAVCWLLHTSWRSRRVVAGPPMLVVSGSVRERADKGYFKREEGRVYTNGPHSPSCPAKAGCKVVYTQRAWPSRCATCWLRGARRGGSSLAARRPAGLG